VPVDWDAVIPEVSIWIACKRSKSDYDQFRRPVIDVNFALWCDKRTWPFRFFWSSVNHLTYGIGCTGHLRRINP
jgi:hypothetical protein